MVQGGIGDHGVEARVGQLSRHDVGMQPADRRVGEPCLRTSQDGRIDVHCRDVGYAPSQPGSQQPVAAPDVEHALGTERHHGIQQSVVVDVGVPRLIHGDILLDGGVVARASPKLRRARNPIQAGDLVHLFLVQPNP